MVFHNEVMVSLKWDMDGLLTRSCAWRGCCVSTFVKNAMEVIMKTALLKFFGVGTLLATLGLTTLQAYALPQTQESSVPSLLLVGRDSQLLIPESTVVTTDGQRQAPSLYDLVQELRTLPLGKEHGYYLQALEQRDYLVLSNYNDHRHWEFALEKTQHNLRLTIAYNAITKTSTMITVSGPRVARIIPTDERHTPLLLRLAYPLCRVAHSSPAVWQYWDEENQKQPSF
jgi:hypothetical protein